MADLFLKIVNMSISASWAVLAVLLLRLALKKAPKWVAVMLWGIVGVRLICPISLESTMSLIPSVQTINPSIISGEALEIDTGIADVDYIIGNAIPSVLSPNPTASADPLQILVSVLSFVWLFGIAAMLAYAAFSYWRLKRKIGTAVLLCENIFQSENVASPFVLGIIKPKIYLPFSLGEQDEKLIVAHEQAHIRRKDHWWKPLGYLLLCVYWFNPLLWLGYAMLCKDIELACDEKVIKALNVEQRADYSQALLNSCVNRRTATVCPLAFGEVGVKERVKKVISYKKPAFWLVILAVAVSVVAAVCFLTVPRTTLDDELSLFVDGQIAENNASFETDEHFVAVNHKVLKVKKARNETTVYLLALYEEYSCEDNKIISETASYSPTVITVRQSGSHGHYELAEYWTPGMGTEYVKDIEAKFPWYLQDKAIHSERYIDEQIAACENAAVEHFSLVSGEKIEMSKDGKNESEYTTFSIIAD